MDGEMRFCSRTINATDADFLLNRIWNVSPAGAAVSTAARRPFLVLHVAASLVSDFVGMTGNKQGSGAQKFCGLGSFFFFLFFLLFSDR